MGHNDHLGDDELDLPAEAGVMGHKGFEPDDDWLKSADAELQAAAMREWFTTRYWDPAMKHHIVVRKAAISGCTVGLSMHAKS